MNDKDKTIAQAGAEPVVNYFAVQEMADKWHLDYNLLSAAIRGYLSLAAPTAQPAPPEDVKVYDAIAANYSAAPLPAREPLTPRPRLTDEQLRAMRAVCRNSEAAEETFWWVLFSRAIEDYYGITTTPADKDQA